MSQKEEVHEIDLNMPKELEKTLPYRERIAIKLLDPKKFIKKDKGGVAIIGSSVFKQFHEAFMRSTGLTEQAKALENFNEWPYQGIVLKVSETLLEKENESLKLNFGDIVYLRGDVGMMSLIEGQMVCLVGPSDITAVIPNVE